LSLNDEVLEFDALKFISADVLHLNQGAQPFTDEEMGLKLKSKLYFTPPRAPRLR
jgi:hypothetical protein